MSPPLTFSMAYTALVQTLQTSCCGGCHPRFFTGMDCTRPRAATPVPGAGLPSVSDGDSDRLSNRLAMLEDLPLSCGAKGESAVKTRRLGGDLQGGGVCAVDGDLHSRRRANEQQPQLPSSTCLQHAAASSNLQTLGVALREVTCAIGHPPSRLVPQPT